MKQVTTIIFLSLILVFSCCGCGNIGEAGQTNPDWGTVYNTVSKETISLGDSEEAFLKKFNEEQYAIGDSFLNPEGKQFIRYELRDGDNMMLYIDFVGGKVMGISMIASLWYDSKVNGDQEMMDAGLQSQCNWCFKDGITAQADKEEIYNAWGAPSGEMDMKGDMPQSDRMADHAVMVDYNFTENWEVISEGETTQLAYAASLLFIDDKLVQLDLSAADGGVN